MSDKSQIRLYGLIAEKTGFTSDYVSKVVRGKRRNELIAKEYQKLENLLKKFTQTQSC
jgi:hypothetical protein